MGSHVGLLGNSGKGFSPREESNDRKQPLLFLFEADFFVSAKMAEENFGMALGHAETKTIPTVKGRAGTGKTPYRCG